jgi:serine protease
MYFKKVVLGLLLATISLSSVAAEPETSLRLIVKFKQSDLHLAAIKKNVIHMTHLSLQAIQPMAGGAYSLILNKKNESSEIILAKLREDPQILYAVQDKVGIFKPLPTTVNTATETLSLSHDIQWDEFKRPAGIMLESAAGLNDGAWKYTHGENPNPIIVAVLDTGIERNPNLINNLIKDDKGEIWGWNFAANNRNLTDETGSYHGTHVSGTIAAYGPVMQGVGHNLSILPLKIANASGMFYESKVINAIYWAVGEDVPGLPHNPYPAKVLNMSFGVDEYPGKEIDYCDEVLQEALSYARAKGAVIVVAAGNDNRDSYNAPAVCKDTLRIAATGPKGYRAYYSNYGAGVTLAAPGGDLRYGQAGGILSTVKPGKGHENSGFAFYQGTSMASPHVAGVAALVYAISDTPPSADYVEKILYTTTHDFGQTEDVNHSCIGRKSCGHGIVDAEQAILATMAKYDTFFTAPSLPIQKEDQRWSLMSEINHVAFDRPRLSQDDSGQIIADFGNVIYQLDQSALTQCKLIGFDGIGCYR